MAVTQPRLLGTAVLRATTSGKDIQCLRQCPNFYAAIQRRHAYKRGALKSFPSPLSHMHLQSTNDAAVIYPGLTTGGDSGKAMEHGSNLLLKHHLRITPGITGGFGKRNEAGGRLVHQTANTRSASFDTAGETSLLCSDANVTLPWREFQAKMQWALRPTAPCIRSDIKTQCEFECRF